MILFLGFFETCARLLLIVWGKELRRRQDPTGDPGMIRYVPESKRKESPMTTRLTTTAAVLTVLALALMTPVCHALVPFSSRDTIARTLEAGRNSRDLRQPAQADQPLVTNLRKATQKNTDSSGAGDLVIEKTPDGGIVISGRIGKAPVKAFGLEVEQQVKPLGVVPAVSRGKGFFN
jgi:hypothetical protein